MNFRTDGDPTVWRISTTLTAARPPPSNIPNEAAVLYQLGLQEMLSRKKKFYCPNLNPFHWLIAYAARTLPHFCADHISVLQNPQVLSTFDTKIRLPLLSGHIDVVAADLLALLPPPPATSVQKDPVFF